MRPPNSGRFVSPYNRLLYLRTLPLLGTLSAEELAVLGDHMHEKFFRSGDSLLREGEPVDAIHVVVEGRVRVSRQGRDFRVFGPRDAVGVFGLLARAGEGVHAKAEVPTLTLSLDADALVDVCEDHFSILHHLLRAVSKLVIDERRELPGNAGFDRSWDDSVVCPARSLDMVERMFFMTRALPFWQSNIEALAGLARRVQEARLARGETLWKSGEASDTIALLVCGGVSCRVDGGNQQFRVGSGGVVGALDAIAAVPRWHEATTESETVVLRLAPDDLVDVIEDHYDLGMDLLASTARELLEVFEQRAALAHSS